MLVLAPPWGDTAPAFFGYWTAGLASLLWIIERIAFFTLIREKGAVYTSQVIYVSTPAAVLWAIFIFQRPADLWISSDRRFPCCTRSNSPMAAASQREVLAPRSTRRRAAFHCRHR